MQSPTVLSVSVVKHIVGSNGLQSWWLNDLLHRLDGPAVIKPHCVDQELWGKHHCEDECNGDQEWWVNGNRHRVDGPAIVYCNSDQEWLINGKHHRLDGPAVTITKKYYFD